VKGDLSEGPETLIGAKVYLAHRDWNSQSNKVKEGQWWKPNRPKA